MFRIYLRTFSFFFSFLCLSWVVCLPISDHETFSEFLLLLLFSIISNMHSIQREQGEI